ncbi:Threonyl-tRNA synthetase [Staphylococcus aureus]|uniref:Threonyl-tRNA synthetase n=1 Tax=Staphylococcus aureus TaxID=1280 RepID=A0A380E3R6_STAAU|nr:Threonyl-tRNA synthetase [Staphylococcus aureus]
MFVVWTLNDSHIFVRPDQIKEEFKRVVNMIIDVYKDFGFEDYSFRLSYRDPEDKKSTLMMMTCGIKLKYA